MDNYPLVSVVTASYNMGKYICKAVDSVLGQDYPSIEIIIVNDGSTDDTTSRLEKYNCDDRVTVINQNNQGQTVAKNRGLAAAQGEFVGFCDADNIWLPGKLIQQVPILETNTKIGVVYGDIALIDEYGKSLPAPKTKRYSGKITSKLLANNFVTFNTTLVPRKILDDVGGFDESLRMAIDYDLWLRISLEYDFFFLEQPLVEYRIWGGQMSHRTGERLASAIQMMDNFLSQNPHAVTPSQASKAWAYTLTTRGLWHSREGRKSEAMLDYQSAISKSPFDFRAWQCLIRLILGM